MRRKSRPSVPLSTPKSVKRRELLEGLSALALTAACSSGETAPEGQGARGAGASSGALGAGASNVAGQSNDAAGVGGTSTNGAGGAGGSGRGGAKAGNPAGAGSGGTPSTNTAGQPGAAAGTDGGGTAGSAGHATNGAGAGGQTNGGGAPGAAGSNGAAGTGGGDSLSSPPWDSVPSCTASKTDAAGQGPFFIHELEKNDDVSLIRQDIRGRYNESAEPGVEMHLHLRVLDSTSSDCNGKPLEGVDVYIWHTDAQGFYSGFGTRGGQDEQNPDSPYSGTPGSNNLENTDRFCRGVQTTDANGVVSFRSIFPGWYNGRDLHIHFVAFKKGSTAAGRVNYGDANSGGKWLFTTQFYFQPEFSRSIHEKNQPYLRRTTLDAYAGAMLADENGNSGLRAKASLSGDSDGVGGVVTAQMQILLDPKA